MARPEAQSDFFLSFFRQVQEEASRSTPHLIPYPDTLRDLLVEAALREETRTHIEKKVHWEEVCPRLEGLLEGLDVEALRANLTTEGGLGQWLDILAGRLSVVENPSSLEFLMGGVEGVLGLGHDELSLALLASLTWADWRIAWDYDWVRRMQRPGPPRGERVKLAMRFGLEVSTGETDQSLTLRYFPYFDGHPYGKAEYDSSLVIFNTQKETELSIRPFQLKRISVLTGGRLFFQGVKAEESFLGLSLYKDGTWEESHSDGKAEQPLGIPASSKLDSRSTLLNRRQEVQMREWVYLHFLKGLFEPTVQEEPALFDEETLRILSEVGKAMQERR